MRKRKRRGSTEREREKKQGATVGVVLCGFGKGGKQAARSWTRDGAGYLACVQIWSSNPNKSRKPICQSFLPFLRRGAERKDEIDGDDVDDVDCGVWSGCMVEFSYICLCWDAAGIMLGVCGGL